MLIIMNVSHCNSDVTVCMQPIIKIKDIIIAMQGNPGTAGQPGQAGLPGEPGDQGSEGQKVS